MISSDINQDQGSNYFYPQIIIRESIAYSTVAADALKDILILSNDLFAVIQVSQKYELPELNAESEIPERLFKKINNLSSKYVGSSLKVMTIGKNRRRAVALGYQAQTYLPCINKTTAQPAARQI